MASDERRNPHDHNDVAPGDAGPGEPGYDGEVQVGDEAADVEQEEPNPQI